MKGINLKIKALWNDESAQGTVEYILIAAIVVGIIMIFKDKIRSTVSAKVDELDGAIRSVGTGG